MHVASFDRTSLAQVCLHPLIWRVAGSLKLRTLQMYTSEIKGTFDSENVSDRDTLESEKASECITEFIEPCFLFRRLPK